MTSASVEQMDTKGLRRQILTLGVSLIMGQVLFLLVAAMIPARPETIDQRLWEVAKLASPLFAVAMFALGLSLHRSKMRQITNSMEIEERVTVYRKAFIVRAASIQTGGFLPLVAYFLSRDDVFLAIVIPMLALQLFFTIRSADESEIRMLAESRR